MPSISRSARGTIWVAMRAEHGQPARSPKAAIWGSPGCGNITTPLPGESLVAFLSDGAFEEQRGWTGRRAGGAPRTSRLRHPGHDFSTDGASSSAPQIVQEGGATWLAEDLRHNGFDPVIVDGRDPMAIAWAIVEAEDTLSAFACTLGSALSGQAALRSPRREGLASGAATNAATTCR